MNRQPILVRTASPADLPEMIAVDDDACTLYARAGLHFDFGPEHPFARGEYARWSLAAAEGLAFLAEEPGGDAVGLMILGRVDASPYLDQLSVRTAAMRQGIGRRLLMQAIGWAGSAPLWLTTYGHLPWNRPFYESAGLVPVPESACPPGIVERLVLERRWLPAPGERIAMRRPGTRAPSLTAAALT
ncbi:MAG: GNAT family N-acetyltransferase [Myxococcaceae bacterium]